MHKEEAGNSPKVIRYFAVLVSTMNLTKVWQFVKIEGPFILEELISASVEFSVDEAEGGGVDEWTGIIDWKEVDKADAEANDPRLSSATPLNLEERLKNR